LFASLAALNLSPLSSESSKRLEFKLHSKKFKENICENLFNAAHLYASAWGFAVGFAPCGIYCEARSRNKRPTHPNNQ
jgi:hypothetical protein